MIYFDWIAEELNISYSSLKACVQLLDEGSTLAFIARYRKSQTSGLKEEQVEKIEERLAYYRKLEKRKESILKSLEDQKVLDPIKRAAIEKIRSTTELEDYYLPFKPKRETKADVALKHGLGRFAALIMKQDEASLDKLLPQAIRGPYANEKEALAAIMDICAQWINENQFLRKRLRSLFLRESLIESQLKDGDHPQKDKYRDYHDYTGSLKRIPSHRLLAILRAEEAGVLKLKLGPKSADALALCAKTICASGTNAAPLLSKAIKQAYQKALYPSLSKEARKEALEKAENTAIQVFATNLRQLLMAPPLRAKSVLAIDPGFKSGCKLVCLSPQGDLKHNENIFPHPPQAEWSQAKRKISQLVEAYKIDAIAIGNGTAGRETENLINQCQFKRKVQVYSVSEAGASVYSASSVGRAEFPQYDVTVRGAVSIGRRLQDPLAELVKIDPKSIGVGQYQHDLDPKKLDIQLEKTVVSVVNQIGVELNQASPHLLKYISGLGPQLAENIVQHRKENGPFRNRKELKHVKGLGPKAFELSVGFLRISDGEEILDSSALHPETYDLVRQWAKYHKRNPKNLLEDKEFTSKMEAPAELLAEYGSIHLEAIRDELLKSGRDQRGLARAFSFDPNLKKLEDLKEGMIVPGLVSNLTKFGAFVDIGLKQAGLIHISEIADRFISDPAEELKLQQPLRVKVLSVDLNRARIQLSLKQVKNES